MSHTVHEIRIHGVSGTPPAAMLFRDGDGRTARIIGYTDALTGFYTDADTKPPEGQQRPQPRPDKVEAYSWGGLTSSAGMLLEKAKRIGWLLLIPFAMVNVAYWTRPAIDEEARPTGAAGRAVTAVAARWTGLFMTMLATASLCVLSMDLLAWQCYRGGSRVCSLPDWLPAQGVIDVLGTPGWNAPSQRVVLAALVPLALIAAVVALSMQSRARYEAVTSGRSVETQGERNRADPILQRQWMWLGKDRITRQILNHVSVSVAVVAIGASLPLLVASKDRAEQLRFVAPLVAATVALVLAFASAAASYPDGIEFWGLAGSHSRRLAKVLMGLAVVASLVAIVTAAYVGWRLAGTAVDQKRDYFDGGLLLGVPFLALAALVVFMVFAARSWRWGVVCAGALLAVVALGVVVSGGARGAATNIPAWLTAGAVGVGVLALLLRLHGRSGDAAKYAWRGAAPAVVLGGAVGVGLLFTTSLLVGAADVLNGDAPVTAIATGYPEETSPTAVLLPDGVPWTPPTLAATGPITITGGHVVAATGQPLVVHSGEVSVSQLTTQQGGATRQLQGLVISPDASTALSVGEESSVALEGACLANSDEARQQDCDQQPATGLISQGSVPVGEAGITLQPTVRVVVADQPQETIVLPNVIVWATTLLPLWALLVLGVLVASYLRFRHRAKRDVVRQAEVDYTPRFGNDVPRVVAARLRAAFIHRAEQLVGRVAVVTDLVFLGLVIGSVYGRPPWQEWGWLRPFGDLGLYFALGLGLALLWFLSQVRTSESARRQAGVLWDIATFLPRLAHPFGPPSYGERVVPETTRRVRELLDDEPERVVILSGHSQGSVIAVAVASRLSPAHLQRVRLVTYGSQLRAWFGRIFPAVLGPDQLGTGPLPEMWRLNTAAPDTPDAASGMAEAPPTGPVANRAGRLLGDLDPEHWANLYRRSDPIGFPIFSDPAPQPVNGGKAGRPTAAMDVNVEAGSCRDIYVQELDDRYALATHSGYQFTDEYRTVVDGWIGQTCRTSQLLARPPRRRCRGAEAGPPDDAGGQRRR